MPNKTNLFSGPSSVKAALDFSDTIYKMIEDTSKKGKVANMIILVICQESSSGHEALASNHGYQNNVNEMRWVLNSAPYRPWNLLNYWMLSQIFLPKSVSRNQSRTLYTTTWFHQLTEITMPTELVHKKGNVLQTWCCWKSSLTSLPYINRSRKLMKLVSNAVIMS